MTDGSLHGSVFRVTTLAANRPGSLRAALSIDQPWLAAPDGMEEHRRWLDNLSADLSADRTLSITPLLNRLGVPSPGSRK